MHGFRRLVEELHRRSLWQVLAVYLGGSWIVLEVVDWLTENAGLPEWTPGLALVLLLIGLPIVLATAFIQEGLPGADRSVPSLAPASGPAPTASSAQTPHRVSGKSRVFTWRNAMLGGATAFSLLGVGAGGYLAMWQLGLGPWGRLMGVLDARDPVVLADFENHTSDATAGDLVTEALRVDLIDSDVIALVPTVRVQQVLERMGRAPDSVLTSALAREVAQRAGFKAVIEGGVVSAGEGYVLTARLIAAETEEEHAAFRESASSPEDLIRAVDKLSERIRNKVGESLPTIRAGEPLSNVTTASLDALRKYVEGVKVFDRGDYRSAIGLLEEATQLDTAFAMAYRKLANAMGHRGGYTGAQLREVSTKAYEHRDRLSDVERYLTIANYHAMVTGDRDALIQAYQNVLRIDPHQRTALNNLANAFQAMDRYEDAAPLLDTAVVVAPIPLAHDNLVENYLMMGDTLRALEALERFEQDYPDHPFAAAARLNVEVHRGNAERTHEVGAEISQLELASIGRRAVGVAGGSYLDRAKGKWREAREHLREAVRFAESNGARGTALYWSLIELEWQVHLAQDTAGARRRMREILESGAFDALPPAGRPWVQFTYDLAWLGMTREARGYYERWDAEVPEPARGPAFEMNRKQVATRIAHAESGDVDAAIREFQELQAEYRCSRCFRAWLAELEARRGNVAEAIALYELVAEEPNGIRTYPIMRVIAFERLGPLYEEAGDVAKAVRAYAQFAEAWKDADPELQPRVRTALERVRILTAEGAGRS